MGLKRIHSGGIECKIEPDTSTRWVISVKYSDHPPASTLSVEESTLDEAKKFAELLYNTYHQKILELPDDTIVLPAHFNGTSIALKHGVPILETLGTIKKKVKLLSMTKDEFIDYIADTVQPRPGNYRTIISINKKILSYNEMEMTDLEAGPNSCAISSS